MGKEIDRKSIAEALRHMNTLDDWSRYKNWCEMVGPIGLSELIDVEGDTSDGYHTFNELYDHRAKLFAVVVSMFPGKSWKSKLHNDGTMFDGMFIVGIDTPEGQATYHYDINPYWDMFSCKEVECAPEWDGHTPSQAINRILSLSGSLNSRDRV